MTLTLKAKITNFTLWSAKPPLVTFAQRGVKIGMVEPDRGEFYCTVSFTEEVLRGDYAETATEGLDVIATLERFGMALADVQPEPQRLIDLGLIEARA